MITHKELSTGTLKSHLKEWTSLIILLKSYQKVRCGLIEIPLRNMTMDWCKSTCPWARVITLVSMWQVRLKAYNLLMLMAMMTIVNTPMVSFDTLSALLTAIVLTTSHARLPTLSTISANACLSVILMKPMLADGTKEYMVMSPRRRRSTRSEATSRSAIGVLRILIVSQSTVRR